MNRLYTKGAGYAWMMVTRPQTLGYGLTDSPAGLAAFFYDKFNDWTYSGGDAEKVLTKDQMLDDTTLYWLTNTAASSAQLYWENSNNNFNVVEQKTREIKVPVAVSVFPGEIYQAPRSWAERGYLKLIYFARLIRAGTSPPGSSRSSLRASSARRSDRCARDERRGRALLPVTEFSVTPRAAVEGTHRNSQELTWRRA